MMRTQCAFDPHCEPCSRKEHHALLAGNFGPAKTQGEPQFRSKVPHDRPTLLTARNRARVKTAERSRP